MSPPSGAGRCGPAEPGPAPYGPPPQAPRPGSRGALIAVVIVAMLVVGGGVFALVWSLAGKKTAAAAPGQATSPASTAGAATTAPGSAVPTTGPTAGPAAGAGTATVSVAPAAAASPAAAHVQALLDRYFAAINSHDYAAYSGLLDAKMRQLNPPSVFSSGYATTQDSAEELTAISAAGAGELAATVTFTSHQSPASSPDGSSCDSWRITLYLLPNGGSYLIGTAPPGYRASYQSC